MKRLAGSRARSHIFARKGFVFLATGLLLASSSPALEPWADQSLPVKDGLEIWLNAAQENAARAHLNTFFPVREGGPLDIWHDASGHKRNLRQPVESFRPLRFHFPTPAVRFDGKDDFLTGAGFDVSLKEATIFIRAAARTNAGGFRAFLGFNASGLTDFQTGMNVDFGPGASADLELVNIEGNGFGGVKNLLKATLPFGVPHTFTIASQPGEQGVQLWLDGSPQGTRGRADGKLTLDELVVGGRFFSYTGLQPFAQGFFNGDISDVLVYNRVLSQAERAQVVKFLAAKNVSLDQPGRKSLPPETVSNVPPVQMFVPGFSVRELPVALNNINNVKYRSDGKLVALGYDGQIWLLSDSDGDGLEDKTNLFWNKSPILQPIGMALTPPGYSRGEGVFVASKGKIALLVDTNHDDEADAEIIVAQNWQPMDLNHGVDALGVAVDKDNSVYFGLGTANFTSGYRLSTNGKSLYDLKSDRGTIQKVSPDFSHRETICTGIRFPVALAFNPAGDLFCTDQEGATWLPNGNPFDELLHIEPGRHYGFPPRHPKYLPGVIDEPSVFDYTPQHQSTCGLNFNEPASSGGPSFGPAWWRGDAIVTGYSRGKLWCTRLAKTSTGYVAQSQLIACLNLLTADACLSPQGDLVVAVHSGLPDWGTGPKGAGKLYKISYTDKSAPQPVLVWAASESETCVEFDRPLDPATLKDVAKSISIIEGRYVVAGDRFETLRPGYQVVQNQLAEPRYRLEIVSTVLAADGRTLLIRTVPRARAVNYAVTLPGISTATRPTTDQGVRGLPQHKTIDLAHDLTGVEAAWQSADGKESWSGWLPHLDSAVNRTFTTGSEIHERLWPLLRKPGKLSLRAQLDLWQMLRAATQPGSKLDFEYPPETVTLVLKSSGRLEIKTTAAVEHIHDREVHLVITPKKDQWLALEAVLPTASDTDPALEVSWFTAEDARRRALPLRRILMPWAKPAEMVPAVETERVIPEIAGGNWFRGKKLFFGEQTACFKCHVVNGRGGKIGPDLSNLVHRDYASVMKDITQPSAAINPDHVAYNVEIKGGEFANGVPVGGEGDEFLLADATGRTTAISRKQIISLKPSAVSLMPEGLINALTPQQVKDLLTYLLMPPPLEPAALEIPGEPPARNRAEIEKLLTPANPVPAGAQKSERPLSLVLCAGPKDHGPSEHDYPLWQKRWAKLLGLAEQVNVQTADRWPSPEQLAKADEIIFYSNNPEWNAARATETDAFLKRGGGLVYLHYAVDGHAHCDELAARIGLAWRGGQSKFRHGPLDLKLQPHPVTDGLERAQFVDESYWNLIGSAANIQLLASGIEEGQPQPLMWTREQGTGRVFVSIPGHYTWTFDDPIFRLLILRGIAWTAHEPLDRFNDLCTIGARIKE